MLAILTSHCHPPHTHNSCGNWNSSQQIPLIFYVFCFLVEAAEFNRNYLPMCEWRVWAGQGQLICSYSSEGSDTFSPITLSCQQFIFREASWVPPPSGIKQRGPQSYAGLLQMTQQELTHMCNGCVISKWCLFASHLPSLCFYFPSFHSFSVSWEEVVTTVPSGTELSTTAYPRHPANCGISH